MDQENRKISIRRLVKKGKQIRFANCMRTSNTTRENNTSLPFDEAKKNRFLRLRISELKKPMNIKSERRINAEKLEEDQNIRQRLQQILPRGAAFYRLAFNSMEKGAKEKKIFSEFFNLRNQDMSGTISTAELWSNKDRVNFLKENKISINKVKLFQKISSSYRKNELMLIRASESGRNIFGEAQSQFNIGSLMQVATSKNIDATITKNFCHSIDTMRKSLADLHSKSSGTGRRLDNIVKELQGQSQNFQNLEDRYYNDLIEML